MRKNIETYSDEELLQVALNYADDHPNFDRDFVDSLENALNEYDEFTDGQRSALQNIVLKFRM